MLRSGRALVLPGSLLTKADDCTAFILRLQNIIFEDILSNHFIICLNPAIISATPVKVERVKGAKRFNHLLLWLPDLHVMALTRIQQLVFSTYTIV